jgi:hypothetical protein
MGWYPALLISGFMALPFVVVWTILSEAVALYLLHFSRFFVRCLEHATIANLASGVVGLVWQFFFFYFSPYFYSYFHWVNSLIGSPPINDYQTIDSRTILLAILLLFLVDWIGSILLEGLVLMFRQRSHWNFGSASEPGIQQPIWSALKASAIINTISYSGLIVALIFQ